MKRVRWIRWSCGHTFPQRLTAKFPSGATVIPMTCPFCGRKGFELRGEDRG